jgi:hypothetical protein
MCISSADIAGRRCSAKNRRPEVSSNSTPPTSSPPWPTATEKASGLALHRDGPAGRRGRLVADAGKRDWDELTAEYGSMLMEGLSVLCPEPVEGMGCKRSTRGKHVNVLHHLMGFLKNHLSSEDKAYRG